MCDVINGFKNMSNLGKHWKIKDTSKMGGSMRGKKHTDETKKKMSILALKENNAHWKGDNVLYSGLHTWIRRWKGQPQYCENCGEIGKKCGRSWDIQWANIDHSYKRILDDYIALCVKCHRNYDIQNKLKAQ